MIMNKPIAPAMMLYKRAFCPKVGEIDAVDIGDNFTAKVPALIFVAMSFAV